MRQDIAANHKDGLAARIMSLIAKSSHDRALQARKNIIQRIIQHPLRTIGIAAVLGCAAGLILKKRH